MRKILCVIVLLLTVSASYGANPDIDLTKFSSVMAYSGLLNILSNPSAYTGQIIKIKGLYDFIHDEETGENYYGVSVMDTSACCMIGIDFVLKNSYSFPKDYPETGAIITVSGRFEQYKDGEDIFCRLSDADIL